MIIIILISLNTLVVENFGSVVTGLNEIFQISELGQEELDKFRFLSRKEFLSKITRLGNKVPTLPSFKNGFIWCYVNSSPDNLSPTTASLFLQTDNSHPIKLPENSSSLSWIF